MFLNLAAWVSQSVISDKSLFLNINDCPPLTASQWASTSRLVTNTATQMEWTIRFWDLIGTVK